MTIIPSAALCEFFAFSAVNFFSFNRREPQSFYAEGRSEEISNLRDAGLIGPCIIIDLRQ